VILKGINCFLLRAGGIFLKGFKKKMLVIIPTRTPKGISGFGNP
jgi:hypothetical protein